MRITSGGNILVGGSNDYSRISVTNGISTRTGITLSDGNTASLMLFAGNNSDAVIAIDTQNLSFKTGATVGQDNGTERMRITSAGNVGIGTTSPAQKLQVSGNTYVTGYVQASSALIGLKNGYATLGSNSTTTGIALSRDFLPSSYPDLIINSLGNVGIGTASPDEKLTVNGITRSVDQLFFGAIATDNITYGPFIESYDDKGLKFDYNGNTGGEFQIWNHDQNGGGAVEAFTINQDSDIIMADGSGGQVGIGTDSPGANLDIVGATNTSTSSLLRVRTTDNPNALEKVVGFYVNTSTERGFISVNQYQTTYSTSSDYRLKENIVPISNSVERLKELKPYRFNFINGDPEYVVDGFIAHEAAEVIPEAVTGEKDAVDEDNNPSYQGIDQSKLVPLLTAALQEAINKIEQLETRIEQLEN